MDDQRMKYTLALNSILRDTDKLINADDERFEKERKHLTKEAINYVDSFVDDWDQFYSNGIPGFEAEADFYQKMISKYEDRSFPTKIILFEKMRQFIYRVHTEKKNDIKKSSTHSDILKMVTILRKLHDVGDNA